MKYVHTSIRTSDMDRSIDFYTRLLGLSLMGRHEILKNDAEIAFLQDSAKEGNTLELTFYKKQDKFIQADYEHRLFDHIAFEVENMEQTISSMREEKITVTDEPFKLGPSGPQIAFVEDPDGTLIELIQRR